ncbi:hypothetical protein VNO77_15661 [Canavalia gladiata]|uniref:Uncharacterized protein n=1 Tax=Canavalia gladiata TaxID=3824 RepID=A0AAN9QRG8_CANGL
MGRIALLCKREESENHTCCCSQKLETHDVLLLKTNVLVRCCCAVAHNQRAGAAVLLLTEARNSRRTVAHNQRAGVAVVRQAFVIFLYFPTGISIQFPPTTLQSIMKRREKKYIAFISQGALHTKAIKLNTSIKNTLAAGNHSWDCNYNFEKRMGI